MSALDQYLSLYAHHADTIAAHSPALLNDRREAALAALQGQRLPRRGDEGYEKTDIDALFAPDYGLNITRVPFGVDMAASLRCGVPNLSTLMAVVVGDIYHPSATLAANLPEGVTMMSLAEAARLHHDRVAQLFGTIAGTDSATTALNTLLVQDGVYVRLEPGVKLDKPLQLINVFNTTAPSMAVRRLLIDIADGASARLIVCDHTQLADIDYLSSQVIEISLGRDASFELYDMEESSSHTHRVSELYARQDSGSTLSVSSLALIGGATRNSYNIRPQGEHCTTELSGLAIGGGAQLIDNATRVRHSVARCASSQLFKYVLFDKAQGAFEGTVIVDEGADYTDAHQTNRNLLASPDARMHTMPQLEIYCDEVKCSHGAATGQLDDEALFYMRQRGIDAADARMMLVQAFMADVIDTVHYEPLRDRLRHLVELRLSGRAAICADCGAHPS